jgi:hypothetical protein
MEADGVGLRRAASNDDKVGGWDGTARREGGRLGKKLMKGEGRNRKKRSRRRLVVRQTGEERQRCM